MEEQSRNGIEAIKGLVEVIEKLIKKKNRTRALIARIEKNKGQLTSEILQLQGSDIRWLIRVRKRELANLQQCLCLEAFHGPERPKKHKETAKYSPIGDRVVSDMKQLYPFSPGSSYSEMVSWSYGMMNLERRLVGIRRSNNPGHAAEESIEVRSNMHNKLRHGSNNHAEERKLLREMKQADPREIELTKASWTTYGVSIPEYLGSNEDIRERIQLIHKEGKLLSKANQEISNNIKRLEGEVKASWSKTLSLQKQLAAIERVKEETYDSLYQLREEGANQVDELISQWKKSEIFRFEYERNKPERKMIHRKMKKKTQSMRNK